MNNAGIVIPTLNEEGSIGLLVERILRNHPELKIIIVDDQSSDGTQFIVEELSQKFSGSIHFLFREEKINGLAGAYIEGYEICRKLGLDWVFQMDADGQHDPADLSTLWDLRARERMVIGSRYCEGGIIEGWSLFRILLSRIGNVYFRILHKPGIRDCTGGYKLFDARVLRNLWMVPPKSRGFTFHAETTFRWAIYGAQAIEAPITFRARKAGDSKMSPKSAFESLRQILLWRILK